MEPCARFADDVRRYNSVYVIPPPTHTPHPLVSVDTVAISRGTRGSIPPHAIHGNDVSTCKCLPKSRTFYINRKSGENRRTCPPKVGCLVTLIVREGGNER
ncbi:hypothetical protein J6590_010148 [Homalodisca vitripennis]|nr:hypothetical protein J6590_010148 [Homalodisca vitripennis]